MNILILCGVFANENIDEVVTNAIAPVEFSANSMQQKLIDGFLGLHYDIRVVSAPFIGAFPNASKIIRFKGFTEKQESYEYVNFINIWGIRNYSRTNSLKKAVRRFIKEKASEKIIIAYCPHTPFIKAAAYAKKKDPSIKLCLYVPDLPQYMNLSAGKSVIYEIAKKYDIAFMTKYMKSFDSFVLLTEQMKAVLPVGNKPYMVAEGIVDKIPEISKTPETNSLKYIVYTGKLYQQFGVKNLIDSFRYIDDKDCRLILCGSGDCDDYAKNASKLDSRICPLGQILPEEVYKWQQKAAILINPRSNDCEYTKYSFPSKNIEYLLTGRPVVGYMLDGMPDCYENFICAVNQQENTAKAIADAIQYALNLSTTEIKKKYDLFIDYAKKNLLNSEIANLLLRMLQKGNGA